MELQFLKHEKELRTWENQFAVNLKMLLRDREHRISDVAKGTGIHKSRLSDWMHSKTSPRLDVRILKLAKYFNLSIEELFFSDLENLNSEAA